MRQFVYETGISPKEIADKAINFLYDTLYNAAICKTATFGGPKGNSHLRECVYLRNIDGAVAYIARCHEGRGGGSKVRTEFMRVFKLLVDSEETARAEAVIENAEETLRVPSNGMVFRIWHNTKGQARLGGIHPGDFDVAVKFDIDFREEANSVADGYYAVYFKPQIRNGAVYINKIRRVKKV